MRDRLEGGLGFVGHGAEVDLLERLVDRAVAGRGEAALITGRVGIGKSALLDHLVEVLPDDVLVLRASGHEAEIESSFGALTSLLWPLVGHFDDLDEFPAGLLRATFGLGPPVAGDRFALAAASLLLLNRAAEARPVVCVIDDWHAVDHSSREVLAFVARRIYADRIAMLFGARSAPDAELPDVVEVELEGLDPGEAAVLLQTAGLEVAPQVAERLVEATGGNPLALLEAAPGLSVDQRLGHAPLGALPVGARLMRWLEQTVHGIPDAARQAALLSSLHADGDVLVVTRALVELGHLPAALVAAEIAGLLNLEGSKIRFSHPLYCAAVEHTATPDERRRAHLALATVFGDLHDPERQAVHLSAGTFEPDEAVSSAMEAAAVTATERGDLALASQRYERAATLSATLEGRARRLFQSGVTAAQAGLGGDRLLGAAQVAASDPGLRSEIMTMRSLAGSWSGDHDLVQRLADEAVVGPDPVDPWSRAVVVSLGCHVAWNRLDLTAFASLWHRASDLADKLDLSQARGPGLIVLNELLQFRRLIDGVPLDERLVTWLIERVLEDGEVDAAPSVAFNLASAERFDDALRVIEAMERMAARGGSIASSVWLKTARSFVASKTGHSEQARTTAEDALSGARLAGITWAEEACLSVLARVHALRGDVAAVRHYVDLLAPSASSATLAVAAGGSLGLAHLGRGDLDAAAAQLDPIRALDGSSGMFDPFLLRVHPDLVESLVRLGRVPEAARVRAEYEAAVSPAAGELASALLERVAALTTNGTAATRHFETALTHHAAHPDSFEEARTRLAYGSHLRSLRRPPEARHQLRRAIDLFDQEMATPWAAQARRQARAVGLRPRAARPMTEAGLTPQELLIAEEAAAGRRNREIAASLYVSPKTVEVHLTRVFRKLGLRSRTELARWFAAHHDEIDGTASPEGVAAPPDEATRWQA